MKRVFWIFLACGLVPLVAQADETVPLGSWPYVCARKIEGLNFDTQANGKATSSFTRPMTRFEFAVLLARIGERHTPEIGLDAASWRNAQWPESERIHCSEATTRDVLVALHQEFLPEFQRLEERIPPLEPRITGLESKVAAPPRFTTSLTVTHTVPSQSQNNAVTVPPYMPFAQVPLSDESYALLRNIYSRLPQRPLPPWLARPMTRYEFGAAVVSLVENRGDEIKQLPYGGTFERNGLKDLYLEFLPEIRSCGVQRIDFETLEIIDVAAETLPASVNDKNLISREASSVVPASHWSYQALDKATLIDFFKDARPHLTALKGHLTRQQFGVFTLQFQELLDTLVAKKDVNLSPQEEQLLLVATEALGREYLGEMNSIRKNVGLPTVSEIKPKYLHLGH